MFTIPRSPAARLYKREQRAPLTVCKLNHEKARKSESGSSPLIRTRRYPSCLLAVCAFSFTHNRHEDHREHGCTDGARGCVYNKTSDVAGDGTTTATVLNAVRSGYLSPYLVTDAERMECVLEDVYMLIHEKKISSMKDLLPLLEQTAKMSKPLLILAEDVEGEAPATLVVNKLRGTPQCAAVKAPGFGDRRKAMLEGIAIPTGGKAITEDLGIKLENMKIEELGSAKKMTIDKDDTTIVAGAGKASEIEG